MIRGCIKEVKMPVEKCTKNGKPGYKSSSEGKCFTGAGSRARASKQLQAIKASQSRRGDTNIKPVRSQG